MFHGRRDDCTINADVFLIILEPDEGFSLRFNVKSPEGRGEDRLPVIALSILRRLWRAYATPIRR